MSVFESVKSHIKKGTIKDDQVWLKDVNFLEYLNKGTRTVRRGSKTHYVVPFVVDQKNKCLIDLRTNKTYPYDVKAKYHKSTYEAVIRDYEPTKDPQSDFYVFGFSLFSCEQTAQRAWEDMQINGSELTKESREEWKRYVPIKEIIEYGDRFSQLKLDMCKDVDEVMKK